MTQLPITPYLPTILQTLEAQQVLILQAEPGAGKSTAVPLYLLQHLDQSKDKVKDNTNGKILMLEPRRLAAKSIAQFLASQLNESVGETVGYHIRNERKVSMNTRLEIITEGMLTHRIQNDPEMSGVSLVIFDEFHERSIHADYGLTLCKEVRAAYNESLKILVMSATMDTQKLSQFLENAPIIESEGRCFPVETHYLTRPVNSQFVRDWLPELNKLIIKALQATQGDVLVFLPGLGEIKRCLETLSEQCDLTKTRILPLYGALASEQQQEALLADKQGKQKVVLATNIAETSLTIENISAVVDSGFERRSLYDVSSGMSRLVMQRISLASADQRKGRAGRVQAGECYRLWTETQQQALKPFTAEEITTTDLSGLQLSLLEWGVKQFTELDWLTLPPKAHMDAAGNLLQNLGLADKVLHNNVDALRLTAKGQHAIDYRLEPRFAGLLATISTEAHLLKAMACDLVAILGDSHFLQAPDDGDLVTRMLALQAFRENRQQAQKQYHLKPAVCQQVITQANKLMKQLGVKPVYYSLGELQENLGRLVAIAFPDRIAKRRNSSLNNRPSASQVVVSGASYLLTNGKGAILEASNALKDTPWLAIADLDGQRQQGRIYLAAEVTQETLAQTIGFETSSHYRYQASTQKIVGKQQTKLGAIVLSESELTQPDPAKIKACLHQAIVDSELRLLPWTKNNQDWLKRVQWLQVQNPQHTENWPDFSLPGLVNSVEDWLLAYIDKVDSIKALKSIALTDLLKSRLPYEYWGCIDHEAPEFYITPSGKKCHVDYSGQLPKVSVVLQEMFGELSSPKLAWGKINLAFELLSPARRPLQVTSDLAHFWQNSYFEVVKEMKGRYPKHRWPEKPLEEQAGRSIKRS